MFKKILNLSASFFAGLSFIGTQPVYASQDFDITDNSTVISDFEVMGLNYENYKEEAQNDYTYNRDVIVGVFESYEKGKTDVGLYLYCFNPVQTRKDLEIETTVNGTNYVASLRKIDSDAKISKYEITDAVFNTSEIAFRTYAVEKFNSQNQTLVADFSNFEDSVKFNYDSIIPITNSAFFTNEYSNLLGWEDFWPVLNDFIFGENYNTEDNYSQHWYLFDTPTEIDYIEEITIEQTSYTYWASGEVYDNFYDEITLQQKEPEVSIKGPYIFNYVVSNEDFFTIDYKNWGGSLPAINKTEDLLSQYGSAFADLGYENSFFKKSDGEYYEYAICYDVSYNSFGSVYYPPASDYEKSDARYSGYKTVVSDATMLKCVYNTNGITYNALALQKDASVNNGVDFNGKNFKDPDEMTAYDWVKLIIQIVLTVAIGIVLIKILTVLFTFIGSMRDAFGSRRRR